MTLNCIIVDDEPLAINLLGSYVERTPFLHLSGTYLNPVEALDALERSQEVIHLLFLDIQMPGMTGMDLARRVSAPTRIIFTTAYKEYAIEGYKVTALDYLLKPFTYKTFLEAAQRGLKEFEGSHFFVKCNYRLVRVDYDKILFINGLKDYVRIHVTDQSTPLTVLMRMMDLEEMLPPDQFCRVHRSYIVAYNKIESIEHNVITIGKDQIPISKSYQDELYNKLKN